MRDSWIASTFILRTKTVALGNLSSDYASINFIPPSPLLPPSLPFPFTLYLFSLSGCARGAMQLFLRMIANARAWGGLFSFDDTWNFFSANRVVDNWVGGSV